MKRRKPPMLAGTNKAWMSVPKYIRVYDNGGRSADRYTVLFTRKRTSCQFMYLGMSDNPTHPQGFGQHGFSDHPVDTNKWGFAPAMGRKCYLGKRIPFEELPVECRRLVMRDYRELWS